MKNSPLPLSLTCLCLLAAALPAAATAPAAPQEEKAAAATKEVDTSEVTISAERMEMHLNERFTELTGNVQVNDNAATMTSDKLRVFTDEHNKLQRIEAEDHVTIRKIDGTESATGDRGYYVIAEDTIVLEGNCTLMQGTNVLQCKRIIYDRLKKNITAVGGTLVLPNLRRKDNPLNKGLQGVGGKEEKAAAAPPAATPPAEAAQDKAEQGK